MLGWRVCVFNCVHDSVYVGGCKSTGLSHLSEVLVLQLTLDLGRGGINCSDIFQILWTISHFKYPFSSPWSLIHRAVHCDPIIIDIPMCSFKYTHTHSLTNQDLSLYIVWVKEGEFINSEV